MEELAWASSGELSSAQIDRYLSRIGLPPSETRQRPPDIALLRDLQFNHFLHVPFDTSSIHLDERLRPEDALRLRHGPGMQAKLHDAFRNTVERRRGGYCFSLGVTYAALLRGLDFSVSEVGCRVYKKLGKDPAEVGWGHWGAKGHRVALVDLPHGRYLTDVGFGGGNPPYPLKLDNDLEQPGFVAREIYKLTNGPIPGLMFRDNCESWLLSRRLAPHDYFSPIYAIMVMTLSEVDWQVLNHWHSTHADAPFTQVLLVSLLKSNGDRLILHYDKLAEEAGRGGTFYVRSADGQRQDEREVKMEMGEVARVLRDSFGFRELS